MKTTEKRSPVQEIRCPKCRRLLLKAERIVPGSVLLLRCTRNGCEYSKKQFKIMYIV